MLIRIFWGVVGAINIEEKTFSTPWSAWLKFVRLLVSKKG